MTKSDLNVKIKILHDQINELTIQNTLLANLFTKAIQTGVKFPDQFLNKNEIIKVMGWTIGQFKYRIPELKRYGMINAGGYRMRYIDLLNYIKSLLHH